jgi:hypothetical protein
MDGPLAELAREAGVPALDPPGNARWVTIGRAGFSRAGLRRKAVAPLGIGSSILGHRFQWNSAASGHSPALWDYRTPIQHAC